MFLDSVTNLNSSVLLFGETGTGKDFWAKYLSLKSRKNRFVNINCGDVPETMLESEWFGYKKGSFTGATKDFDGRWSSASGGILFLNQIDLLSPGMQARILRVLENGSYFNLGSSEEKKIDSRIIFSADWDINEKVNKGLFRRDLFYRISSLSILIPPLRERKEDIMPLLLYYSNIKKMEIKLTSKGKNRLLSFPWMGNIREVENFVNNISISKNSIEDKDAERLAEASSFEEYEVFPKEPSWEDLEKKYIQHLLKKYDNRSKVARILKISRKSLYNKIKKYGNN